MDNRLLRDPDPPRGEDQFVPQPSWPCRARESPNRLGFPEDLLRSHVLLKAPAKK